MLETYAIACYRITHINGTQPERRPFCLTFHRLGRLTRSEGDGADRLDFLLRHGPNTDRNLLLQGARVRQHLRLMLRRAAHP